MNLKVEKENADVKCDLDNIIFSKTYIENEKTKKFLDYIWPNKADRKKGERNEIKNRLKYILNVFDELSEYCPIFDEPRYGKHIKLMYLIIYGNHDDEFAINKQMPKKLYTQKIKRSDCVVLTEKYIYSRFMAEGKDEICKVYLEVDIELRNQFIRECKKRLDSIIKMMDD